MSLNPLDWLSSAGNIITDAWNTTVQNLENLPSSVEKVTSDIGHGLESAGQEFEKIGQNIIDNPLPVIETLALAYVLGPEAAELTGSTLTATQASIIASSAVTAANGGDIKQIATSAAIAFAGAEASSQINAQFSPTNASLNGWYQDPTSGEWLDSTGNSLNLNPLQSNLATLDVETQKLIQNIVVGASGPATVTALKGGNFEQVLTAGLSGGVAGLVSNQLQANGINPNTLSGKLIGTNTQAAVNAILNGQNVGTAVGSTTANVLLSSGFNALADKVKAEVKSFSDSFSQLQDAQDKAKNLVKEAQTSKANDIDPITNLLQQLQQKEQATQESIKGGITRYNLAVVTTESYQNAIKKDVATLNQLHDSIYQSSVPAENHISFEEFFNNSVANSKPYLDAQAKLQADTKAAEDGVNYVNDIVNKYTTDSATLEDINSQITENNKKLTDAEKTWNDTYGNPLTDLTKQITTLNNNLGDTTDKFNFDGYNLTHDVASIITTQIENGTAKTNGYDDWNQQLAGEKLGFGNDGTGFKATQSLGYNSGATKMTADEYQSILSEAKDNNFKTVNEYLASKSDGFPDANTYYDAQKADISYYKDYKPLQDQALQNNYPSVSSYVTGRNAGFTNYDEYAKAQSIASEIGVTGTVTPTQYQNYENNITYYKDQPLIALENITKRLPLYDTMNQIIAEANQNKDWAGAAQKMNDALEQASKDPNSGLIDAGNGIFANQSTQLAYTKDAQGNWTSIIPGHQLPDGTIFRGITLDDNNTNVVLSSKQDANGNVTLYANGQEGYYNDKGRIETNGFKLGDILENVLAGQKFTLADGTVAVANDGGKLVSPEAYTTYQKVKNEFEMTTGLPPEGIYVYGYRNKNWKDSTVLNDVKQIALDLNAGKITEEQYQATLNNIINSQISNPTEGTVLDENTYIDKAGQLRVKDEKGNWDYAETGDTLPNGQKYEGLVEDVNGDYLVKTTESDQNGNVKEYINGNTNYTILDNGKYQKTPTFLEMLSNVTKIMSGGYTPTDEEKLALWNNPNTQYSLFGSSYGEDPSRPIIGSDYGLTSWGVKTQQQKQDLIVQLDLADKNPNLTADEKAKLNNIKTTINNTQVGDNKVADEQKAKAKAEAEAKAKSDAEAKRLADEAAAKAQADAEAKAQELIKQQADAKAKIDDLAKQRADALAKGQSIEASQRADAQAKADALEKQWADAKAQQDLLQKQWDALLAQNKILAQQQAEAKAKADADARAKALAEQAQAKAESDAKAQKLAEQARIQAEADAKAAQKKSVTPIMDKGGMINLGLGNFQIRGAGGVDIFDSNNNLLLRFDGQGNKYYDAKNPVSGQENQTPVPQWVMQRDVGTLATIDKKNQDLLAQGFKIPDPNLTLDQQWKAWTSQGVSPDDATIATYYRPTSPPNLPKTSMGAMALPNGYWRTVSDDGKIITTYDANGKKLYDVNNPMPYIDAYGNPLTGSSGTPIQGKFKSNSVTNMGLLNIYDENQYKDALQKQFDQYKTTPSYQSWQQQQQKDADNQAKLAYLKANGTYNQEKGTYDVPQPDGSIFQYAPNGTLENVKQTQQSLDAQNKLIANNNSKAYLQYQKDSGVTNPQDQYNALIKVGVDANLAQQLTNYDPVVYAQQKADAKAKSDAQAKELADEAKAKADADAKAKADADAKAKLIQQQKDAEAQKQIADDIAKAMLNYETSKGSIDSKTLYNNLIKDGVDAERASKLSNFDPNAIKTDTGGGGTAPTNNGGTTPTNNGGTTPTNNGGTTPSGGGGTTPTGGGGTDISGGGGTDITGGGGTGGTGAGGAGGTSGTGGTRIKISSGNAQIPIRGSTITGSETSSPTNNQGAVNPAPLVATATFLAGQGGNQPPIKILEDLPQMSVNYNNYPQMAQIKPALKKKLGIMDYVSDQTTIPSEEEQIMQAETPSAGQQASFNQTTLAQSPNPTIPALKSGGALSQYTHNPEFITGATGHYVKGKGDGQSDDIPAMLADGEYVFDADTVAQLGNGSSDAGAKLLDHFREALREHKRSAPNHKIPPKASPLMYMKEALRRHSKG